MNKVTVKKVSKVGGDTYFSVQYGNYYKHFSFKPDVPSTSIYNEEKNRLEAMALAAYIENGAIDKEEIIYQTP